MTHRKLKIKWCIWPSFPLCFISWEATTYWLPQLQLDRGTLHAHTEPALRSKTRQALLISTRCWPVIGCCLPLKLCGLGRQHRQLQTLRSRLKTHPVIAWKAWMGSHDPAAGRDSGRPSRQLQASHWPNAPCVTALLLLSDCLCLQLGESRGGLAAVMTEDSDLVPYGCPLMLFKCDRGSRTAQALRLQDLFDGRLAPAATTAGQDGEGKRGGGKGKPALCSTAVHRLEGAQPAAALCPRTDIKMRNCRTPPIETDPVVVGHITL